MTASRWLWSLWQGTSTGLAQCRMTPILKKMVFSITEKCTFWLKIFKTTYKFSHFFSFSRKACLRSLKTDVVLRPIANLKALLAANTIKKSRKFCVTRNHSDSFESVFQRSGTLLNGSAIHSKKITIRSNSYGYPFEKEMSSLWLRLSVWKNCHPFE